MRRPRQREQLTAPIITNPNRNSSLWRMRMIAGLMFSNLDLGSSNSLSSETTSIPPWNLSTDGWEDTSTSPKAMPPARAEKWRCIHQQPHRRSVRGTTMAFPMWQVQERHRQFMIGVDGETGFAPNKDFDPHVYVFSIGANGVLTQLAKILRRAETGRRHWRLVLTGNSCML